MKHFPKFSFLIFALQASWVYAQVSTTPDSGYRAPGVAGTHAENQLSFWNQLKINGWVHVQYQATDTLGAATVAGGNFPAYSDNRFILRRGRIRFTYEHWVAQYVLQVDVVEPTPSPNASAATPSFPFAVNVRDFYTRVSLPVYPELAMVAGMQNRPFGFDIAYSSQFREIPERSRFVQTLFPNERDLGAIITVSGPRASVLRKFRINAGFFNGTAIAKEFDSKKDFIGQAIFGHTAKDGRLQVGLGVSYYAGGVVQTTKYVFNTLEHSTPATAVDSAVSNAGAYARREYFGADAQVTFAHTAGTTTLRGEYVQGIQPGARDHSRSPDILPNYDTYMRSCNGGYLYLVHRILKSPFQLAFRYDWYDPNTKVSGLQIQSARQFAQGDIRYETFGYGINYLLSDHVKFTAYYDRVVNERTGVPGFEYDRKDDVYTLRVQYRF
jgi:hypothetical protein